MQAVILAGGLGTRLYPVLKDLPKPMAPVGDKCILEIVLEFMKGNGIQDFIFCVRYMAEKIISYFGDGSRFGVSIRYSIEKVPLGTGGALGLLRNQINETFCLLNGDTYQELNLQECIRQHKARSSDTIATLSVVNVTDSSRYGQVITDTDGCVTGFVEKGMRVQEGLVNSGLYVLEPAIFDYVPESKFVSFEQEVLTAILKGKKKINTYQYVYNFFDIGIPEDYFRFVQWTSDKEKIL